LITRRHKFIYSRFLNFLFIELQGPGVSRINRINANNYIEKFSKKKREQEDAPSEYKKSFGVLNRSHPAASILQNSALVVARQLEMLNVFLVIFDVFVTQIFKIDQ
jgi:hypothetical protein